MQSTRFREIDPDKVTGFPAVGILDFCLDPLRGNAHGDQLRAQVQKSVERDTAGVADGAFLAREGLQFNPLAKMVAMRSSQP